MWKLRARMWLGVAGVLLELASHSPSLKQQLSDGWLELVGAAAFVFALLWPPPRRPWNQEERLRAGYPPVPPPPLPPMNDEARP